MDTFTVPCVRCDEFRARFVAEGFTVLGCEPHSLQADMCILKYERPTVIPAMAADPSDVAPDKPAVTSKNAKFGAKPKSKAKAKAQKAGSPPTAASAVPGHRRFVNVKALNMRATPSATSPANVLRVLSLGQALELIGDQQSGWWPVQAANRSERGFVKALIDDANGIGTPGLRLPAEVAREALVGAAVRQWERFRLGQGKETVDPFFRMVGEMWAAIGLPHDGRDDIPWSAAAISFMVREAAADHAGYRAFKFAASHSKFVHDAIRKAGQAGAPFHAFRLFEHRPQLGDLVARSREGPITFEQAAASDAFKSHTDIVVAVHADEVYAIGGNVSDSVGVTRYEKTDSGHLSETGGVFALLTNRA